MARAGRVMGFLGVLLFAAALIAVPNLLRSRIAAGEASPDSQIRIINTAAVTYAATYPAFGFPPSLRALGGAGGKPAAAGFIDSVLARGGKLGYRFRYAPARVQGGGPFDGYTVHADPEPLKPIWWQHLFGAERQTGVRHYFSDQPGVIRYEIDREAGPASPPLQ